MRTSAGRWPHALAGLVTGLAGIAVSHAATMALNLRATPLLSVGEAIIEVTPGPIAEGLIQVVGRYDKPLLVGGVTFVLLALSAWAGALTQRSQVVAQVVFVLMGVVAAVAVWTRPGSGTYDVVPVVLGTATWLAVLSFLVGYLARTRPDSEPGAEPAGQMRDLPEHAGDTRRGFLVRAGSVVGVAAVLGVGGEFLGRARRGVEATRRLLRLPISDGRVPQGADLDVAGIEPWRSGNAGFYRIDTALVVPAIDPNEWKLRIHGMVENEIVLTYRDLVEREMSEAWVTICCVSNPVGGELIGNAWWSGVRIADLLEEAGVDPNANAVLQTSEDGWNCGTPLEALTDDRNSMLAIAMNGEPLPVEHGFPVRMIVPGLYGYVSATKWLVDLEVRRFEDFTAYWTERGWSAKGPVKTQSRIDVPRDGADLLAGAVRFGGSAWAQDTGVQKVEYRLDGNEWREATLGRVPGADTWVQWSAQAEVPAGSHTLAVRATDTSGYTQTSVRTDVVPSGATGWHTIKFATA